LRVYFCLYEPLNQELLVKEIIHALLATQPEPPWMKDMLGPDQTIENPTD
jgi:hypothetical protein